VPSTTLRVTFGTQSAESQKADAVPAGVISAAINAPARTGTAMRFLRSAPSGSGRLPLGTKSLGPPESSRSASPGLSAHRLPNAPAKGSLKAPAKQRVSEKAAAKTPARKAPGVLAQNLSQGSRELGATGTVCGTCPNAARRVALWLKYLLLSRGDAEPRFRCQLRRIAHQVLMHVIDH